jgi:WD40 repeat protein
VLPDGEHIISGLSNSKMTVWDLKRGEALLSFQHTSTVSAVAITSDGRRAISGSGTTIRIWNLEKILRLLSAPDNNPSKLDFPMVHSDLPAVRALAVTLDGRRVVSIASDSALKVWDLRTRAELTTLPGNSSNVQNEKASVVVTPDSRHAIFTFGRGAIKIWDLEREMEVQTISGYWGPVHTTGAREVYASTVHQSRLNPDIQVSPELADAARRETWELLDAEILSIAVLDNNHFLTATPALTLMIWDLEQGKELHTWRQHPLVSRHVIECMAVLPNEKRLVVGSYIYRLANQNKDELSTISVWDVETGVELLHLSGHTSPVFAVAVTSDGKYIVSGSGDETLKVWDLEQGAEIFTLKGHLDIIGTVAITPDGRYAVSGSHDCTVKVWDLKEGRSVASFTADNVIRACTVAPDGATIIAGDDAGCVHFFHLEVPERRE